MPECSRWRSANPPEADAPSDPTGGEAEFSSIKRQIDALAAPYAKRSYTFLTASYLVAEAGVQGGRETACTYVGESPLLLRVEGEDPDTADDLINVLDPALGCIHLRSGELALPFVRE